MATTSSGRPRGLTTRAAAEPLPGRRRRNLPMMVSGVLLVAGSAAVFAVLSVNTSERRAVLFVRHDVAAGTVLTQDDLGTVHAAAPDSLHLITESDEEAVIGRATSVPLAAQTLLTRETLAQRVFPPAGQAVLGVALAPGRLPPGLVPGLRVQAYQVGTQSLGQGPEQPGGAGDAPALPITLATVLAIQPAGEGEATVVEIQLPKDDVPQVAAAAATGRVALALVAGR